MSQAQLKEVDETKPAANDSMPGLTIEEVIENIQDRKIDLDDIDVDSDNPQQIDDLLRRIPKKERMRLQHMPATEKTTAYEVIEKRLRKLKEIERQEEADRRAQDEYNSPEAVAARAKQKEDADNKRLAEAKARDHDEYIETLRSELDRLTTSAENEAVSPNQKYIRDKKITEIRRILKKNDTPAAYYAGEAFRKAAIGAVFTATYTASIVGLNMALNLFTGGAYIGLEISSILIGSALISAIGLLPVFKENTVLGEKRATSFIGKIENGFEGWAAGFAGYKKMRGNENNDMVSHEKAEGSGRGSGIAFAYIGGGSLVSALTLQHCRGGSVDTPLHEPVSSFFNTIGDGLSSTAKFVTPDKWEPNINNYVVEPMGDAINVAKETVSAIDGFTFPGASLLLAGVVYMASKHLLDKRKQARNEAAYREKVLAA